MLTDKLRLYSLLFRFVIPFSFKLLYQQLQALRHRWTYKAIPTAKNIVVIGGSFVGVQLAKRLSQTLPTGYRVVLIEKNSHFNYYVFTFPRFSVMPGYERLAFIPYYSIERRVPAGIFRRVHDIATSIASGQGQLASGGPIDYEYLVVGTGASQPLPARVVGTDRDAACVELRTVQENVQSASRIAIIGGGAVGVEIATDIKS